MARISVVIVDACVCRRRAIRGGDAFEGESDRPVFTLTSDHLGRQRCFTCSPDPRSQNIVYKHIRRCSPTPPAKPDPHAPAEYRLASFTFINASAIAMKMISLPQSIVHHHVVFDLLQRHFFRVITNTLRLSHSTRAFSRKVMSSFLALNY